MFLYTNVHVVSESCVELGLLYSISIANHSHSAEWADRWKFTFKTITLPGHNRLTCLNQWYIQLTLSGPETPKRIRWQMSRDMRFPKMWHVRPAKAEMSLRIRAVWSEHLLVAWILYDCWATDRTVFGAAKLKRRLHRLVWVYTCQNATLLEITCRGSKSKASVSHFRNWSDKIQFTYRAWLTLLFFVVLRSLIDVHKFKMKCKLTVEGFVHIDMKVHAKNAIFSLFVYIWT